VPKSKKDPVEPPHPPGVVHPPIPFEGREEGKKVSTGVEVDGSNVEGREEGT
jgi:hypothetical protein